MVRVAAIAIDALESWYLDELLDRGCLPNLARLRARSARWDLRTPLPYRSELAWTRFLGGREPLEEHDWGVAATFDPNGYRVGMDLASTVPPFFALGPGTKVISLDLIHAALADDVDGVQVMAWGSHSPQWPRSSSPTGLLTEIDARFGTNPAFGNEFEFGWHDPAYIDALTEACAVGGDRRADIARWLVETRQPDWDLLLVCLSEFHTLGHQLWHGVDPTHPLHGVAPTSDQAARRLEDGMVAVDRAVGRLLELLDDDTVVVLFAFHGFQPADDLVSTLLLPELFQRHLLGRGLFRDPDQAAWRRAGCPPVVPPAAERVGDFLTDRFADSPRDRARRGLGAVLPPSAFDVVRRASRRPATPRAALANRTPPEALVLTPAVLDATRKPPTHEVAYWYHRHWSRLPWFALPSFADGHVRVNLRGRESQGVVDKEDYGRALDDVERLLRACTDARTGRPVVADVLRMRDDDPMDPTGADADLLVIWDGAPDALTHPEVGTIGPFPHLRAAQHSDHGFAYAAGPGIAPGPRGSRPTEDLPPTILSLLGRQPTRPVRGHSLLA